MKWSKSQIQRDSVVYIVYGITVRLLSSRDRTETPTHSRQTELGLARNYRQRSRFSDI